MYVYVYAFVFVFAYVYVYVYIYICFFIQFRAFSSNFNVVICSDGFSLF